MISLATYFCKVILLSGMFYGYYWIALRNERFHGWNRVYLLGATAISLAIPLMRWSWFFDASTAGRSLGIVRLKTFTLTAGGRLPGHEAWTPWLWVAYGLVSLGIVVHRLAALSKIRSAIRRGVVETRAGYRMVRTGSGEGPFSFFHYIFWGGETGPDSPAAASMLRHEIIHAAQYHSVDKLFMELMIALVWINPFFYLIRKELHLVHEFLADERACGRRDAPGYAELLLSQALCSRPSVLTNAFFQHQLSRRVRMLLGERRPGGTILKRVLSIPFILAVSGFILLQQGGRAAGNPVTAGVSVAGALTNAAQDAVDAKTLGPLRVVGYSRTRKRLEPPPPPRPAPATAGAGSPHVFTFVETMPSFPGGERALMHYLSAHIRYPASAREDGHSGTVVVQFNVARDGSLDDVVALPTGVDAALRAEAVRVVSGMPRWTPGRQAGRTVVVRYSLPIRFVLQ